MPKNHEKTCWSMSMTPDRSVPGPVKKSPRPPGRPGRVLAGCPGISKGKGAHSLHFREFPRVLFIRGIPARPWFGPSQTPPNRLGNAGPGKARISQNGRQGTWTETLRFGRRRSRWDGRKIPWGYFLRLPDCARLLSRFPEKGVKNNPFPTYNGTRPARESASAPGAPA